MITSAPYRRRDHSAAGNSTCVRPHARHRPRRGRNRTHPCGIAISRTRAKLHLASTPPHGQRSTPRRSRDSTLDPEPRTVTTRCHLRHRRAAFPGSHGQAITGEGRCHRLHGHGDAVHQPAQYQTAG
jgi:hypothetical protein